MKGLVLAVVAACALAFAAPSTADAQVGGRVPRFPTFRNGFIQGRAFARGFNSFGNRGFAAPRFVGRPFVNPFFARRAFFGPRFVPVPVGVPQAFGVPYAVPVGGGFQQFGGFNTFAAPGCGVVY